MTQNLMLNRSSAEPSLSVFPRISRGSCNGCRVNQRNLIASQYKEHRLDPADEQLIAHFWARVDQRGLAECWPWTLSRYTHGSHGQYTYRIDSTQFHFYAHRIAWLLTNGSAGDLKVCHHCDNPPCCNPSHLFLGTQADNLNDARRKGRLVDGLAARKLSDDAYRDILSGDASTALEMACKYGVSRNQIVNIRRGHSGSTYRNSLRNVVPVRSVQLPVLGDVA